MIFLGVFEPKKIVYIRLKKSASEGQDWGDGIGASKTPVLLSTTLGEMMINDCYRKNRFTQHLRTAQVTIDPNWSAVRDRDITVKQQNQDARFFQENDNFLYDPNTYEMQSVGDDIACPIADRLGCPN